MLPHISVDLPVSRASVLPVPGVLLTVASEIIPEDALGVPTMEKYYLKKTHRKFYLWIELEISLPFHTYNGYNCLSAT